MGHTNESSIIYVGLARLPQPLVAPVSSVAVELEVEPRGRRTVAASTTPQFPGLEGSLRAGLVGNPIEAVAGRPKSGV